MKNRILESVIILAIGSIILYPLNKVPNTKSLPLTQNNSAMKNFVSIVEIPATDITRSVSFYQAILDIEIQTIDMQGTEMGIFPSDGQSASVVITKGEGYEPATDGVLVHLNGGDNLQTVLNKVEKNGGKILLPKTLIDEENGYFALFLDSEGNRMGVHSMK